jgi:hypothetical protein
MSVPTPRRNRSGRWSRRPFRPALEALEGRDLPAIGITAFDPALGTLTFTGGLGGSSGDNLVLAQVSQSGQTLLAHNLSGNGTGDYASATDVDAGAGVANFVIGSGSAPQITVDLGANDTLTLDSTWTFAVPIVVAGGGGTCTIVGPNSATTWDLSGPYSGDVNGPAALQFSNIQVLQGGSATNTFNINGNGVGIAAATLIGGPGTNVFNMGPAVALTGSIDGQSGADTLNYASYGAPIDVTLTADSAGGYSGTEASISGGFTNIDVLTGSGTGASLTGLDVSSAWDLGVTQSYVDNNTSHVLSFSGFQMLQGADAGNTFNVTANTTADLTGGNGSDDFIFSNGAVLTGSIDGVAGGDTLDLSASTASLDVALTAADTNGVSGTAGPVSDGFAHISTLRGGTGSNTLAGDGAVATWDVSSTSTYTDGTATLAFTGFTNLQGGGDSYVLGPDAPAVAITGSGATLDYSTDPTAIAVTLSGSTVGGFSGSDIAGDRFTGVSSVVGNAGSSLTGENCASTWTLGNSSTYSDGTQSLAFAGIQNLQGGSAADTFDVTTAYSANLQAGAGTAQFIFSDGATLTGTIAGGTGTNTLDLSAYSTAVTVTLTGSGAHGFSGTDGVDNGFSNISAILVPAGQANMLVGDNAVSTWNLGTSPTYTDGTATLSLANYAVLEGGSETDTFNITANTTANLLGGAGGDRFVLGRGITLTGSIDGSGPAVLDLSASTSAVSATLNGSDPALGFSGTITGITGGFAHIASLVAGSGANTITGEDVASTWTLNGSARIYSDGTATLSVAGFQTLQAGGADDTFIIAASSTATLLGGAGNGTFRFANGATLTGTITGQGGSDTLDLSAWQAPLTVTLTGSSASGFSGTDGVDSGFSGIGNILPGSGATLVGENVASTWTVAATGSYSDGSHTLTFAGFSNLQGGSAADTFDITGSAVVNLNGGAGANAFSFQTDGAALTGTITGSAGTNTLDYAGYTTSSATVTLTASNSARGYTGSATGISGGFTGISTVHGGPASDTLVGRNVVSTWTLGSSQTYSDGATTLNISNFALLQGGSAGNTFNVSAAINTSIRGGAGNDRVNFTSGNASLSGTIDGQGGTNTLSYAAYGATVQVNLAIGSATGTGGIANIGSLIGSSGANTVTGANLDNTWSITGTNAGNVTNSLSTVTFSGFANLTGGSAADTFMLANGARVTGTLDGGAGVNTLNMAKYGGAITVNVTGTNTGNVVAPAIAFANMQNWTGGAGNDTLVFANGAGFTGTVNGGAGVNTLNDAAVTSAVSMNVTANNAGTVTAGGLSTNFVSFQNWTGGSGSNTIAFANGKTLSGTINGGRGTGTMDFSAYSASMTLYVNGAGAGKVAGTGFGVTFTNMQSWTGGSGNDTVKFANAASMSGTLTGGGGTDTLDYSAYRTGVRVDLATHAATGVGGSINGFANVIGGWGNDTLIGDDNANVLTAGHGNTVLVGNGGNDTLIAGAGRDILIGGSGADSLTGGVGQDLLIGGSTSYDNNIAALTALMVEWSRSDISLAARIAHLSGSTSGGRNGSDVLNVTTVTDDHVADDLTGGTGLDWFISNAGDVIANKKSGDTVTNL